MFDPTLDALRCALATDQRIAYGLLFGSAARGESRPDSDLDVAVGLAAGVHPTPLEIGDIVSRLESACGRTIDLVLLDEAPAPLAFRVFRDGVVLVERDRPAMVTRKTQAIIEYLDFKPVEELCTRGVLRRGR